MPYSWRFVFLYMSGPLDGITAIQMVPRSEYPLYLNAKLCESSNNMNQDLNDLFILSISVYIGSVLTGLFNSLTHDILMPLAAPFTTDLDNLSYTFLGKEIKLTSFLTQIANLFLGLVLVYFTFKGFKRFLFERR